MDNRTSRTSNRKQGCNNNIIKQVLVLNNYCFYNNSQWWSQGLDPQDQGETKDFAFKTKTFQINWKLKQCFSTNL